MGDTLISEVGPSSLSLPTHTPHSKLKTYGFIITIIMGIGGLALGAAGTASYFHVGALSNMAQIDAIIMMAAGGGGGVILLIVGIVGTVKDRQSVRHQSHADVNADYKKLSKNTDHISSVDTQSGLVYGPKAWPELGTIWGCDLKILDQQIPDPPKEDMAPGTVRIYIPKTISINGVQKDLTLNNLIAMNGDLFGNVNEHITNKHGNETASGSWIDIDRDVIKESRNKNRNAQEGLVKEKGCRMPSVLEAVVLNLMVFALTGERLYGTSPQTYTRCCENSDDQLLVFVGAFGEGGLNIYHCKRDFEKGDDAFGVAAVRQF